MSAVHLRGLRIEIDGRAVVDGVDLDVAPGECVAIVGESGAGKSLTARALLGMLPAGAHMATDDLRIDGVEASGLSESSWRSLRGRRIALISQDALAALDPLRRIGREVAEPMEIHRLHPGRRKEQVVALRATLAHPHPARRAPRR
ncbi:MAG: ATP-binding cassette domain-containing protein, partial [Actinomycetota bacterium]|nr:ATP-binding cassette domain-containing protein [Actinomycetota bacterium]